MSNNALSWHPIQSAPKSASTQVLCYRNGWDSALWLSFSDGGWSDEDTNVFEPTMWCKASVEVKSND